MAIFQQDNVLQWLFEGDPVCSSGYFGDTTQHDPDIYHGQYVGGQFETECSNIENDEIIAQALQEEFSQLSITEETGFSHVEQEHMQVPVHKSDWLSPSTGNYYSGHESGQEETDDIDISSLCSSPEVKLYDGEEYSYPLELTDESAFDGEVGKILNQMISVRHVPRINGEIPSNDEATSDHQRLLDRLQLYNLVELKVQGDGNCQFRALSDQFYRTPEHHKFVRRQIVNQLKSHPELYDGYVPMAYDDYLKKMSKKGEWGDHVTLQAAADSYGVRIFVITSFKDTCYIEILPKGHQQPKRVIFLSFWSEVHYNSIYPQGDDPQEEGIFNVEDTPSSESRKKKRWWGFGNKN